MDRNYFKNKYKVNSVRLSGWDYSWSGYYFFTICAKDRQNFFGEIKNRMMGLNDLGCIVWQEWHRTQKIRQNIRLDEFVVMPNHVHGIIEIIYSVETHCNASLQLGNKFGPQRNNLGSIIRGIKGGVVRGVKVLGYNDFSWQPRFHDHVIKTDTESLEKIRYYIKNNPCNWL
jgi:REP element-mobilizing transposase RayT